MSKLTVKVHGRINEERLKEACRIYLQDEKAREVVHAAQLQNNL